ncbi:hypothetical protein CYY_005087 [Polysphondylium violaceum]|uniref:Protein kinase domain-containing protein n=1 Tax=Polysphondylium violaceum TaxID=133409 RepID=A0A8J4PTI7_9MYCE|nr:hypothetical protein CYY_005087 [Polysphondylium violaceum]
MESIKLVMVGGDSGKTSILVTFTTQQFPSDYVPTAFDNYCINLVCKEDNRSYSIGLWESSGQEEYERLRPLMYTHTNVFMILFSVVDHDSYNKALNLWYNDYKNNLAVENVPIILCGTKIDLRNDQNTLEKLAQKNQAPITPKQGEELRKQINADIYCECSSLTQQGLDDLFENVMKAFINKRDGNNKSQKKKPQQKQKPQIPYDTLFPLKKDSIKIQGKTLTQLLQSQSFDEILSDVLSKKINVYNEIKKEEVEFGKEIASGASGKVYQGTYQGKDVAIKLYSEYNLCFNVDEFNREVTIMTLLDHECFTTFYGANKEDPSNLFLVSELVKSGSLSLLLSNKPIDLTYAQKLSIAIDVANAMNYLHSLGIIHRDLKSGNVLITEDLRAKVIDFGFSRNKDVSKQMTSNIGTCFWMAPEVIKGQQYTDSCDVYSFGIVLWEIYCRSKPYQGISNFDIPVMVCKGERPKIPSDCPADYAKLIKACWTDNPKKRPKFNEIHSTLLKIQSSLNLVQQTISNSTELQPISNLTISSNDSLPPIERYVPMIQGKTLAELLSMQSFNEILNDILSKKINIFNEIQRDEVDFGKEMASGASGKVYKGTYKGRDVAIKVYSENNIGFSVDEFDREVSIMTLLHHECFTTFYGANKQNPGNLFLVSELVKSGSLIDLLSNKQVELTYAQKLSIAIDIANAMSYLHSLNVIHRDLKTQNVLITEGLRAKVIDFGTSRNMDASKNMTVNLGTVCWMAPEVIKGQQYTESCDVYAFGIILWELYTRLQPYDGVSNWTIPVMVDRGERPKIPSDCPTDYAKLVKTCWTDSPKKRPTFNEIHLTLLQFKSKLNLGQRVSLSTDLPVPPISNLTAFSSDSLPPIEKYVPTIQGKTLTQLLSKQSFNEILNDVLTKKTNIFNEIKRDESEFGKVMVSGACSKVYQGRYKERDVAIKVCSKDNLYFNIDEFNREVTIMTLLDHECITRLYGANKEDPNNVFLVSEFVKGGSMRDLLLLNKQVLFYYQKISIAIDIVNAMKYLHSLGVFHRDLKSGNVLITQDLRAKLIGVGIFRDPDLYKKLTLDPGTSWTAPEVIKGQQYTESCDVYSFGIILWELYCRSEPYPGVTSWTIPVIVCEGKRPKIPSDCPSDYSKLIKSCWADKAKKRPTFNEIHSTLLKIQNNVNLGQNKSKK